MSDLMRKYYPNGAPIIIQVAFKHGYGPAIIELNQKVYFNENLSFSPLILEAIQAVCLSSCENDYCTVMHTRGLISLGFELDDVRRLIEYQKLPDSTPDREIWERSLRRIATLFREPELAAYLYDRLREDHDESTVTEIGGVVAFALLHKFLLEFYCAEINIDQEPILFKTIDCGAELIAYFTKMRGKVYPVYTICCSCKDVKVKEGWVAVERVLPHCSADAAFSHGLCPSCGRKMEEAAGCS